MKQIVISIVASLATAMLISSCNKEQNTTPEQNLEPRTFTLSITAQKAPVSKAVVYNEDNNTIDCVWAEDDEIQVLYGENDGDGDKVVIGTLRPLTPGTSTTVLSGEINTTVKAGKWIDLWYGGDLSTQDGTLESISNNHYDWAKAWFEIKEIVGSTIVPKGSVIFNNWQSIARFSVKSSGAALPISQLVIKASSGNLQGGSGNKLTVTPASATSELFVAMYNTVNPDSYVILAQAEDGWYSCTATNKSFVTGENAQYYDITLNVKKDTYTVAGYPGSVFNGSEWAPTATTNDLVYDAGTGTYSKSFTVPGNVPSISFKVVKNHAYDNGQWPPSSDYAVNGISNNGYSKTITISFNPATDEISSPTIVQNTSAYHLYVLQEGKASSTDIHWGSTRTVTSSDYTFTSEDDAELGNYQYKHFLIPDYIVDGAAHDITFAGDNSSEVVLNATLSTSTNNYYFRTNGVDVVSYSNPSSPSALSTAIRIWAWSPDATSIGIHTFDGTATSTTWNESEWGMTKSTTAKCNGSYWFYYDISNVDQGKTTKLLLRVGYNNTYYSNQTVDSELITLNKSYYYMTGDSGEGGKYALTKYEW